MMDASRALVERLFNEHGAALEAYLFRRTGNHADACELTQETYLRMLQVKDIESIREPRAYIFTIAAHLADERLRSRGRLRGSHDASDPLLEQDLSHSPDIGDAIDRAEMLEKVRKYLDELPANVRAAYILQVGHGMSYEEIALHLKVTKHTVKKYLQQVVLHCQRRMREDGKE